MREAVGFAEFAEQHPEIHALGINVADDQGNAREFVEKFGWTFPSLFDPGRKLAGSLGASYQPLYALLDADGKLVARTLRGDARGWAAMLEVLEPS